MCNDKINLLDAHVLGVGVVLMYACVESGCGYLLDEILGKNKNMSLDFPNGCNQMIRRAVLYIIELEQCEGLKFAGRLRAAI